MIALPYLFEEIYHIFSNAPFYVICLELLLFFSIIWIALQKKKSDRCIRFNFAEEEKIIEEYTPDSLVPDTEVDHPALFPHIVVSRVGGKEIKVDGFVCLNLASHNYLGLLEDAKIQEDAIRSLRKYGVGSCGPRGFYGTLDVHLDLEEKIAEFMGMEEAVVYSYGFSTIASAIPAYSKRADIIFVDEKVNFAIQKGLDASRSKIYYFKHNDMDDLEKLLLEQENRDKKNPRKALRQRRFLVAEAIYMNTGRICPLPKLVELRKKYKLRLFLDESISFGTLGKNGRGLTEHFNIDRVEVDLISAGMEWAMSSIGGFCVGTSFIVEHQRLSGLGYCFSASLPPLLAEAAISALDRFKNDSKIFQDLTANSKKLHLKLKHLSEMDLQGDEISPVKHLYLRKHHSKEEEQRLLREIVNRCIESGLAIVQAQYLEEIEKHCPRDSIRITSNRLFSDNDIDNAFIILEKVSKSVLA